jgi:hypothetical protein
MKYAATRRRAFEMEHVMIATGLPKPSEPSADTLCFAVDYDNAPKAIGIVPGDPDSIVASLGVNGPSTLQRDIFQRDIG